MQCSGCPTTSTCRRDLGSVPSVAGERKRACPATRHSTRDRTGGFDGCKEPIGCETVGGTLTNQPTDGVLGVVATLPEGPTMFRNILVAVDASQQADQALSDAIDLAESQHARPDAHHSCGTRASARVPSARRTDWHPDTGPARGGRGDPSPGARPRAGCRAVTTMLTDQPILIALIRQIDAGHHDLVLRGSRGRGAVGSTLLGSVSHYVLNHSPVSVLIVHAKRSPDLESLESNPVALTGEVGGGRD
jgi:nucleotide-binding universal stress UspA family protein